MKFEDYLNKNMEFVKVDEVYIYTHGVPTPINNVFIPVCENAIQYSEMLQDGEVTNFLSNNTRDLKFHKAYFAFLNFVYGYMPKNFKKIFNKIKLFYSFLKIQQGRYRVVYKFKNGLTLIETESISFARMDEKKFREFIKEQIPVIYGDVLPELFTPEIVENIIETIEVEFEKFMTKLFAFEQK